MFTGFSTPNTTPVPDQLIDELMAELSGSQFKVVIYIVRRTLGFKKNADDISLDQMVNGIKRADGSVLDNGTGLNKDTVINAVKSLVEKGVITAKHNDDPIKGYLTTTYSLRFKDTPLSENPTTLVGKSDIQETDKDTTNVVSTADGEKPTTPHQQMFAAVVDATGLDPSTNRGVIGKAASKLRKAGRTVSDVERFVEIYPARAAREGWRTIPPNPTHGVLTKYIAWVDEIEVGVVVDYNDAIMEALSHASG